MAELAEHNASRFEIGAAHRGHEHSCRVERPARLVFQRLFGYVYSNGTVNGANDFSAFGNDFDTSTVSVLFDFNHDGPIDFAQFGSRFGITL